MWESLFSSACGAPYLLIRWRETSAGQRSNRYPWHTHHHQRQSDSSLRPGKWTIIVMLHGFGGWQTTWHRIQPALNAAGYRTIGIDAVGAGASSRSPHESSDDTTEARSAQRTRGA
jgi:pimeloyl-ACP methyl ester carboxylesterase